MDLALSEILPLPNYYPFGLEHKGYNEFTSSLGNDKAEQRKFGGKELQSELGLGWYDITARNYDPALGRWMNLDPLAEKYYSISPYVSYANNPISFIDPDGRQILFWNWSEDDNKWEQVKFEQLPEEVQKAVEAFAKTEEGNNFLADFAEKGDRVGSVEFKKSGKYSKHELAIGHEFNGVGRFGKIQGNIKDGDDKVTIEMPLSISNSFDSDLFGGPNLPDFTTRLAITVGHEAFIHGEQWIREVIELFDAGKVDQAKGIINERLKTKAGKVDHNNYEENPNSFSRFLSYISQLKQVLNPNDVEQAKKQHDTGPRY